MALRVAHIDRDGAPCWAVEVGSDLVALGGDYPTTRAFFEQGGPDEAVQVATAGGDALARRSYRWLSPVTRDAQFVCQATNYASHVREVGRDPANVINNVLFRKASSCIAPADSPVIRPRHVRLLDYEIELGLVLRKGFDGPIAVTAETLGDWIGALVIVNDVSARDVQISHEQFHKAKSYRTFGPVGPWLVLISREEARRIGDLVLSLSVDDELRQQERAGDMIFPPHATLAEVSQIMDLNAGDLIATGTPGGVALHPPSPFVQKVAGLLSPRTRFAAFMKGQLKRREYLQPGQRMTARIATPDGMIDLGEQRNRVVGE